MDGIVHLLLWQVLGVPVVTDPMHAPIERITFSVSLEGGGVPSKWPSFQQQPHRQQQQRQRKLSDVGPLPSKALLAAMEACGAGGLADEMLALEHRGVKIWITADVPEGSQSSGHAVLRAVGTDMSCFTPALQQELQHFVVLSDRPKLRYGIVGAPECGDVMQLHIRVNESGVIEDAKFKCFGCGSAIASSSLATEWIKGKNIDEALAIKNTQIVEELSLPPVKIHCSVLAEDSIRSAIADYKKKNGLAVATTQEASAH